MAQTDLYEIYDFYTIPWWKTPWILASIGFGLTLLIIAAWWFFARKKITPPWQVALEHLHGLRPDRCNKKDEFKVFYFALSNVLKTYLDARYFWQTKAKTDEELLAWLELEHPAHPCTAMVKQTSENMLLIKFANVEAIKSQAVQDKQAIIDLINKTVPTS